MSKKTQKKKQQKIIEDRTFGLKNKNKSKAVQSYVKGVQNTVKNQGKSSIMLQQQFYEKKKQKKRLQQQAALLNALYADAKKIANASDSQQDQDPANTVCPYFKQGLCQKGKKCIYSHDLTIGRTQQIDLYVDQRTQLIMNAIGGKQLGQLTQQQLGKILGEKQQQMMKGTRSKIVCKHFLDAVEKDKYGWKWNCPNGQVCKYKHCLPPGYKLKKDQTGKAKIQVDQISIQERIDQQRNQLLNQNKKSPLVTLQLFTKWKAERKARKQKQQQDARKQLQKKKGGKGLLKTGVQLFKQDPNMFVDDEQAVDEIQRQEYIQEQQQEVEKGQGQDQDQDQDQEIEKEKMEETNNNDEGERQNV